MNTHDATAFGVAETFIQKAERLRLCPPCCEEHADLGTDLQGYYTQEHPGEPVRGYWMVLLVFPEVARN